MTSVVSPAPFFFSKKQLPTSKMEIENQKRYKITTEYYQISNKNN